MMAVKCEFIDFIIPIQNIDQVYPGGFEKYKADHIELFSGRMWHDDFLFRDGAMNYRDIERLIGYWEKLGLKGLVQKDGLKIWRDFCVVEGIFGGPTEKCEWLVYDQTRKCVCFQDD